MAALTDAKNLTTKQAAELLGVSHHTLIEWRRPNRFGPALPFVKVGRRVFYRPSDIRKLQRATVQPVRDAHICTQEFPLAA